MQQKGSAVGGELPRSVLLNVKEKWVCANCTLAWLCANDVLFAPCILQRAQAYDFIRYRRLWGEQRQVLA